MRQFILNLKTWTTKLLEFLLIAAVALLVLDVVWGVFTRIVVKQQANWTEELARFLLVWVTLLGGAVAFGTKGHLGVDYFVGKFHADARKCMAVVGHLVVLFFAVAVFLYGGSRVVSDALAVEQMTPALGWKMGYVYAAVPLAGVFILLFSLEEMLSPTLVDSNHGDEAATRETPNPHATDPQCEES